VSLQIVRFTTRPEQAAAVERGVTDLFVLGAYRMTG
jgi:hypothetical protein